MLREGIEQFPFGICDRCGYEFNSEELNEYDIWFCPKCGSALRELRDMIAEPAYVKQCENNLAVLAALGMCSRRPRSIKSGIKYDTDKPRMELLPMGVLMEISKVLTYRAKKYAPDNWKHVENAEDRYTGALLRHLALWREGEKVDKETGEDKLLHIAQVATNALFLVWFELSKREEICT